MTGLSPDEVTKLVEEIKQAAQMKNNELAHALEDALYVKILKGIRDGTIIDAQECARRALLVDALPFERWYV